MILIAHRGNIKGPIKEKENSPNYILQALNEGYDVEVDVWYESNNWWLGHDEPEYSTTINFLETQGLWIHCKNYNALQLLSQKNLNIFYHTNEDYVLTSKNYIWAYPGKFGSKYTICVMPEWSNYSIVGFCGVCSDYVGKIDNDKTNFVRP